MKSLQVSVAIALIVLLAVVTFPQPALAATTITTFSTTITVVITCPDSTPPQGEHIGFGNSSSFEAYDVDVFFTICGYYSQYGQIHVAVTTAWVNNAGYQNATSLAFSFDGAYYWLNSTGQCSIAEVGQPAIKLHLLEGAYYNTTNARYYPPSYGGQGDLCFEYPQNYHPVFIVTLPNGQTVRLHQPLTETPYTLNIGPEQTSTTQSTTSIQTTQSQTSYDPIAWFNDSWVVKTLGNVLTIVLIVSLVVLAVIAVWKRRVLRDLAQWSRIKEPPEAVETKQSR